MSLFFRGIPPTISLAGSNKIICRFSSNSAIRVISKYVKVKPVTALKLTSPPNYVSPPNSKLQSLLWSNPLRNVLITKKPLTVTTKDAMVKFITHLHDSYPEINVIVQSQIIDEIADEFNSSPAQNPGHPHVLFTGTDAEIEPRADLLVTLGGDGTILHAVSMFNTFPVPPVLAFSLGTLGFLLPFNFKEHSKVFESVLHSRAKCLHRTRLSCHVVLNGENKKCSEVKPIHAMNDIFLHRGSASHLAYLDIYIDGKYLTRTTADGVALSTPTGSTAYSLSAGGSIVSPLVPCILLTPICPRSLSFRPLIFPHSSHVKIKVVTKTSYTPDNYSVKLSIDGLKSQTLKCGDEVHIVNEYGTIYVNGAELPFKARNSSGKSKPNKTSGIYCIAKTENDWSHGINDLLGFNSSFRFSHLKNPDNNNPEDDNH